jgi:lipocalin-like protein
MKLKNVMLGLVVMLAVACGPKDSKDGNAAATDSNATETPAVAEVPATTKEMIAKTWVLDGIDYQESMAALPEADRAGFKSLMDEMIPLMKGKNEYNFTADGKATMNTMGPDKTMTAGSGTWALSADEKTLTVTNNGQSADMPIVEIAAGKLVVQQRKLLMTYVPK